MKSRKNIRLPDYNYDKDGYYFVTICSAQREPFAAEDEEIIKTHLKSISTCVSGAKMDYYVVMDNHIHLILVLERSSLPLGAIVRRFKAKVTKDVQHSLWQSNYYEHVIRNDKALNRIREYIQNNPNKDKINFEEFYN